jgi:hypothetical protein
LEGKLALECGGVGEKGEDEREGDGLAGVEVLAGEVELGGFFD